MKFGIHLEYIITKCMDIGPSQVLPWMALAAKYIKCPGPGTSNVQCMTTNWNKCVLCQEDTTEVLRSPAYSKCDAEGIGYNTITANIMSFDRDRTY